MTQSKKRPPLRAPEAHSLSFFIRPLRDGSKRFESIIIDADGTVIPVYLETSQFCPYAGYRVDNEVYAERAPYPGKVIFRWSNAREGGYRLIGYFAPIGLEMLDNHEWLPKEQYLARMRVELTPQLDDAKRRLTARHGRLMCRFPPGAKVKPGVKAPFLLKEEGNFAWAIPLSEQQAVDETAIVHLAGEAGIITDEELMVVQTAHKDSAGRQFFRRHDVYVLLSDRDNAQLKVTALSSREDLKKAHNAKVKRTNPDTVFARFEGGIDAVRVAKPDLVAELESLYAGINLAFKNACELLDRKAKKERPAAKTASAAPTAEEFFGIPATEARDEDDGAEEQASSPEDDALAGHVDQRVYEVDEVLNAAREIAGMEVAEFAALDATHQETFIAQAKSLLREADPTATFKQAKVA